MQNLFNWIVLWFYSFGYSFELIPTSFRCFACISGKIINYKALEDDSCLIGKTFNNFLCLATLFRVNVNFFIKCNGIKLSNNEKDYSIKHLAFVTTLFVTEMSIIILFVQRTSWNSIKNSCLRTSWSQLCHGERGKSGFVSALCALQLISMMHDTY